MIQLSVVSLGSVALGQDANKEETLPEEKDWRSLHPRVDWGVMALEHGYPGMIEKVEADDQGRIVATLANGTNVTVAEFDGPRTFEQRIESPFLSELLSDPYPRTISVPRWPVNFDPGRYRSDEFFKCVYGETEAEVGANLEKIDFCGHDVYFNKRNGAAEALKRVADSLVALLEETPSLQGHLDKLGGGFSWRPISGTNRLSSHSFAAAIDLNPKLGGYWKWSKGADLSDMTRREAYPAEIVEAFEREKFIWGGKWYHFDLMHFEYRPEFFV